jgi:hypothetical protein
MNKPYDPAEENRRSGARGYFEFDGIGYRTPGEAGRARADVMLAELKGLRGSGVLHTKFGEREVWFRSDAEIVAAIAALEAQLNPTRPRSVMCRPATRKGW